jgi:hypothetical protein
VTQSLGVPRAYVRMLVELEDFLNKTLAGAQGQHVHTRRQGLLHYGVSAVQKNRAGRWASVSGRSGAFAPWIHEVAMLNGGMSPQHSAHVCAQG